jgi:hypothetical protein
MLWTSMPEAAIDEHGESRLLEHEVRLDRTAPRSDSLAKAKPDAQAVQCRSQPDLRHRVSRPDCSHRSASGFGASIVHVDLV